MMVYFTKKGFLKLIKIDNKRLSEQHSIKPKNLNILNPIFSFYHKNFCSFPSGLKNYGMNCYLNVLLQVIFYLISVLPPFEI